MEDPQSGTRVGVVRSKLRILFYYVYHSWEKTVTPLAPSLPEQGTSSGVSTTRRPGRDGGLETGGMGVHLNFPLRKT